MNTGIEASKPAKAACAAIRRVWRHVAVCTVAWAGLHAPTPVAAQSQPPRWMVSGYSAALASFRQARYPEAYGRFITLAEWGHAPAARHALWMCEHGQELFGRSFDCSPDEIQSWAIRSGSDPVEALRRIYPGPVANAVLARARH
jgi:hypothetical protein